MKKPTLLPSHPFAAFATGRCFLRLTPPSPVGRGGWGGEVCLLAALAAFGVTLLAPFAHADPPPVATMSKPVPPADTRSTPVRFTLQLQQTNDIAFVPPTPTEVTPTDATSPAKKNAAPPPVVPVFTVGTSLLASPVLTTLDDSTANIAVGGGDLSYSISLSPAIASNGKILTLWNIRLGGKSLPGATAVTAAGATKIDAGKQAIIAEISLTDPATGHRATFVLQGITLTGDAAMNPATLPANPAPTPPAGVPATP